VATVAAHLITKGHNNCASSSGGGGSATGKASTLLMIDGALVARGWRLQLQC